MKKSAYNTAPFLHKHDDFCGCGHKHSPEAHPHAPGDSCGCDHDHSHAEHEHHHVHDEECGCSHNHSHEEAIHPHEHSEACGCGHDHSHEEHKHHHVHDEECGCGHEHHHEEPEQHHILGDGCGCGHQHHAHEEACACGHDPQKSFDQLPDDDTEQKVYLLENLGCAHCAAKMEEKIQALPGITYASITYATRQLRIAAKDPDQYLPEIRKICTSIESGVEVMEKKKEPRKAEAASDQTSGKKPLSHEQKDLISILTGAVLFLAANILGHMGMGTMITLPLFVLAYLILGGTIVLEAVKNISHGQIFDENFLMSIATLGAFAIREYPEAVGVMLFYRVGEYFEHRAVERSRGQIMDAIDMRPEIVNRLSGKEVQVIPAEDAIVGDLLLIRPGDRIPLDGVIVEGTSRLDTSPITGEPVPVAVNPGDSILSGCVNTNGQLTLRVEKPLSESMVSRIMDSVENAAASKPKIDRFITKFAKIYTPCVVFAAAAIAVIPSIVSGSWYYWIYTALTFLVMSCPCALVLSVPLAFFSGIGAGSKKGILFKGGVAMEALSHLNAVVMDKTGTITEGNFQLQKIISTGAYSEEELLAICAGCEQNSTHPIATSIVSAAREKGLQLYKPENLEEIAGHGIAAKLSDKEVLCGNRKLMEKYHVSMDGMEHGSYGAEVFLAIDQKLVGCLIISDTIKADARSAIQRLKKLGLHTVMLTGDSQDSARAVAEATGIDEVYAKLLPEDKLTRLTKVRDEHGAVMFIGDGINDAPVLAGADVGAAMGSGADAAIEAADAVFMTSSMESIPDSIAISRNASRIALQNVVFALVIKIAVMILGLMGYANMWMAVFADTGVAMICVLNSIRILYHK